MALTVSTLALFLILTAILLRTKRLTVMTALPVFLLGFSTASTGAAGPIRDAVAGIAQMVTNLT
ncbi:hypothetical protein ACIRBX_06555 [Kitasatospora sp. NPDC096147]|uniref:hypothetical protein n=1 Tax=Kitasatospora sp. NPDC096147 TaxID=3364093 RepID=UPI00381C82F9